MIVVIIVISTSINIAAVGILNIAIHIMKIRLIPCTEFILEHMKIYIDIPYYFLTLSCNPFS